MWDGHGHQVDDVGTLRYLLNEDHTIPNIITNENHLCYIYFV